MASTYKQVPSFCMGMSAYLRLVAYQFIAFSKFYCIFYYFSNYSIWLVLFCKAKSMSCCVLYYVVFRRVKQKFMGEEQEKRKEVESFSIFFSVTKPSSARGTFIFLLS